MKRIDHMPCYSQETAKVAAHFSACGCVGKSQAVRGRLDLGNGTHAGLGVFVGYIGVILGSYRGILG